MALWNQMQTCIPHRSTLSSWNSGPLPSKFTFFFQFENADILMKDHVPIEYKDPSGLHLHINICALVILDWLAKLSVLSHLLTRVNYLSSLIANKKWCTFFIQYDNLRPSERRIWSFILVLWSFIPHDITRYHQARIQAQHESSNHVWSEYNVLNRFLWIELYTP